MGWGAPLFGYIQFPVDLRPAVASLRELAGRCPRARIDAAACVPDREAHPFPDARSTPRLCCRSPQPARRPRSAAGPGARLSCRPSSLFFLPPAAMLSLRHAWFPSRLAPSGGVIHLYIAMPVALSPSSGEYVRAVHGRVVHVFIARGIPAEAGLRTTQKKNLRFLYFGSPHRSAERPKKGEFSSRSS